MASLRGIQNPTDLRAPLEPEASRVILGGTVDKTQSDWNIYKRNACFKDGDGRQFLFNKHGKGNSPKPLDK